MIPFIQPRLPIVQSWRDALNVTFTGNSTAWNGNNLRQFWNASLLADISGQRVRLTLQSTAAASEGAFIASMYMGHMAVSGDNWDFDGTQVQVTQGGNTSWLIPNNSSVVTDDIAYNFNGKRNFIVAAYFNDSANDNIRGLAPHGSATAYFKVAADETSVADVTGYSATNNASRLIRRIEVFT